MRRSVPGDRAGFALSLLLFVLAWPSRPGLPEECAHPWVGAGGDVECARGPQAAPRLEGPLRRLFGLPIDPNRADRATLETLPGIGPARADAIVRERCRRPFASIEDLERVPGLGPHRVGALEPFLEIEPGLALEGRASVKSSSCRSSCENDGGSGQIGSGCRRTPSAEARK